MSSESSGPLPPPGLPSRIVSKTGEDGVVGVAARSDVFAESADRAVINASGSSRPRFDARRRMPVAARADRKNLGGALGSKMSARRDSEDEHAPSALRHSEVASVEDPVSHAIPEFDQRTEERRHVSPAMTGEKSRYVLEEDEPGSVNSGKVEEGVGEAGPGSLAHAAPFAGDAEILAGEPAGPEGCAVDVIGSELDDAPEVRDSGPSLGEDRRGVGVDLGEADGSPSGSLKPKVKPSDPGEEGGVREVTAHPSPPVLSPLGPRPRRHCLPAPA
jgi:hypothetical protein